MKEKKYPYDPANLDERKKMEKTKARYKSIGWTFVEIPFDDGSGKIWVLFTPPEKVA